MRKHEGPRFHLIKGGGDGSPPADPVAQARQAHLEETARMFDHLVNCGGRTENERAFVAVLLADGWRVAHPEHGYARHDMIKTVGFAGDAFPAPILRDYYRGIDVVFRFPLRLGERVLVTPFAFFSDHGVRSATSVDDDVTPEAAHRDRAYAAAGWCVYRFSNAEMRRDVGRVVCELLARLVAADWVAEDPSDTSRREEAAREPLAELQNYDSWKASKT